MVSYLTEEQQGRKKPLLVRSSSPSGRRPTLEGMGSLAVSLRHKTLITLSITLFLLLLMSTGAVGLILGRHARALEQRHVRDHVQQAQRALQNTLNSLDAITYDWAAWDDTYAFVQDRDPAYVESNMVDSTFTGLGIHLMCILDTEGRVVFGKAVDLEEEVEVPLPEGLWKHLTPGSPLLHHPDTGSHLAGILLLPEGPMLVASRPILTSDDEGPIRGTFIMGRFLDEDYLGELGQLVGFSLTVHLVDGAELPGEVAEAIAALEAERPGAVAVVPLSGNTVAGYALLEDVYDDPALCLQVDLPRDIYRQSIQALRYTIASLAVAGLILTGVALYLVERMALVPLTLLSAEVARLETQPNLSARLRVRGEDELARLGHAFNRALGALEERESQYQDLVERANDGIAIVQEGLLQHVNPRLASMLGYMVEEMEGTPYARYIAPDELPKVQHRYEQRMRGKPVPSIYETVLLHKDGKRVLVELNAGVVTYRGAPADCIFVRDITERRRLEEERQRVKQLESIGVLAGGIAHDFNNILTGILGNVSLAKIYSEQPEVQETLEKAEKACLRARDLTRQLLTFAKGGTPVRLPTSIAELVQESASFVLRGSPVRAEFGFASDLWAAEVDEGQIGQVIQNLVLNAREAMPQGGVVRIGCTNVTVDSPSPLPLAPGRYVCITVEDEGLGIPKEHLPRIFEPYFTTKQTGHGLGLAVVYSIVRRHGGHITVESELGKGSRFAVYLPAADNPLPRRKEGGPGLPQGKGRVLVMDDEEAVREAARAMLEHLGYQVEVTEDGAEAVARYQAALEAGQPFCAAILDLTVPGGVGGLEAAQELLQLDPEARLIVSSGYYAGSIMSEFAQHGFRSCLAKPYRPDDLAKALQEALGRG